MNDCDITPSDDDCGCCELPRKPVGYAYTANLTLVKCGLSFKGRGVGTSVISQEDAVAKARAIALQEANLRATLSGVSCEEPVEPEVYEYTAGYTAYCPEGYTGQPVTKIVKATSLISVADAKQKAEAQAEDQANQELSCAFVYVSSQGYTAYCPEGKEGNPLTIYQTRESTNSQEEADTLAYQAAMQMALAQIVCTDPLVEAYATYDVTCWNGQIVTGGAYGYAATYEEAYLIALNNAQSNAFQQCPPEF